jgi:hypothetical protein
MPARRAIEFFAKSLVSWICFANGSMSGASRESRTRSDRSCAPSRWRRLFNDQQQLREGFLEHVVTHRVHRNLHGPFLFRTFGETMRAPWL